MMRHRRSSAGQHAPRLVRRALLASLAGLLVVSSVASTDRPAGQRGALIPIHGVIDDIMLGSLERRIDAARTGGATTLIFEMDTPGGMVTSAMEICRLIMRQSDNGLRTVAWVNPDAYSAGAMISLACDEVWMAPVASIGDCAPIMIGASELGETERAKAESPILQMFRESATRNGYDQLLCRAMVQVGVEVWWVERIPSGTDAADPNATPERRFVSGEEKKQLIDDVDEAERQWRLVEMKNIPQPIDDADTLLTVSTDEALVLGLARGRATTVSALGESLSLIATPPTFEVTTWERFVSWLNDPMVRGVVFLIMLIGGYLEFQHPGVMVPGCAAAIAAVIFFGAPYAAGLADIWTIVLLVLGLILLVIELGFLPGFGVFGFLGLALIAIALIGTFVPAEPFNPNAPWWRPLWPELPGTWTWFWNGVKAMTLSLLASIVGLIFLARYLPHVPIANRLTLGNPEGVVLPRADAHLEKAQLGDVGVVVGDLKPSGQARFGNDVVDVTTQGQYVGVGTKVQVVRHEGLNIFVRPLPDEA